MHPLKTYLSNIKEPVQDFAVRVGTSRQTLHRIFSGAMDPRPALAKRIVEATGGAVTFEMLYRYRACCGEHPISRRDGPCQTKLDRVRIRTALSIVVNHMSPKGRPPPSCEVMDASADAVLKIFDALSKVAAHAENDRIARSFRPVINEMLQLYGVRPTAAALDQAARLGLKLYKETESLPADP